MSYQNTTKIINRFAKSVGASNIEKTLCMLKNGGLDLGWLDEYRVERKKNPFHFIASNSSKDKVLAMSFCGQEGKKVETTEGPAELRVGSVVILELDTEQGYIVPHVVAGDYHAENFVDAWY